MVEMVKKSRIDVPVIADIDDMRPSGACPICGYEVYTHPAICHKSVFCLNCKKQHATCMKCGKITSIEPWLFLLDVLCVECSKLFDRKAAKQYFGITEFDSYYVALDELNGQWAHLEYND